MYASDRSPYRRCGLLLPLHVVPLVLPVQRLDRGAYVRISQDVQETSSLLDHSPGPSSVEGGPARRTLRAMNGDAHRWTAVFVVVGVLLPLGLWVARDALGRRARNVVLALAATMLLLHAVGSLGRTSFLGYLFARDEQYSPPSVGNRGTNLALFAVALAVALAASLALRPRDEAPDPVVEHEPVVEDDLSASTHAAETIGDDEGGRWSSHVVESALPSPTVPLTGAMYALLLVTVALALPLHRLGVSGDPYALYQLRAVTGSLVALLLLEGVMTGLALLLPALLLRERATGAVAGAFVLVALGKGAETAWPDTLANVHWFVIGGGLALGLLLPTALRLIPGTIVEDRVALGVAVLVAAVIVIAGSALQFRASFAGLSGGFVDVESDSESAPPLDAPLSVRTAP